MSKAVRILGRANSINVQKVIWCASEHNIPFVVENFGGKYGFTDEFVKLNPNKTVPAIVDANGFTLFESHAICKYLDSKYASSNNTLYPVKELEMRAKIDQWMDWQATVVNPLMRTIFWTLVRTKPEDRNLDELEKATIECNKKWQILNNYMKNESPDYVHGNKFSLADISLAISAHRWLTLVEPKDRDSAKHVEDWYKRMGQRTHFKNYVVDKVLT